MTNKERLSQGLLTETDRKPAVIDDLRNGQQTKLYNHNVVMVWVKYGDQGAVLDVTEEDTPGYVQRWRYDSLRVDYPVDSDNTLRTLLNARYGADKESKLQNEYQSAVIGLMPEEYKEPYQAFLRDRLALKRMIDEDFENISD